MANVNDVDNTKFVELWIAAYKEGIGLMGLVKEQEWQYGQTSARATGLRRAGVKLPTMVSPKQKNNYLKVNPKPLNDLIVKELGQEALTWRTR